ncbi:class I SAM-dependent DNA methyltransferase [Marinobacter salarius]|uniref:class I SAM-dependent DNA methyltransferase n=1 Tax=Marinobacter salarius TaxID=1420917 RepID=UPI0018F15506|nr:class I SAM-dependent DNA methyltransferase [Marinobacter salarius]MBJ7277440.1 class I SAM-dependent DNA methyltransferase [Marinobacter salarius]
MNAVEIEEAISELALEAFDKDEFPFAFLRAFGNKETTIKRLRAGTTNKSDLGGVLQTNNIHIAVAGAGEVTHKLGELRESPATARAKARFILSTDGVDFEAEDLETGETVACEYQQFPDHFGFFLPLAGISTVKQLRDSSFDIRATSRLNRLYVELLKDNPDWGGSEQRHEMNHFMARLIFCFFAEDTDIFAGDSLFTDTVEQMSARDSSNTHEVIGEIFRAMNTWAADRLAKKLPRWTERFPYVNGGLFSGNVQVPVFSKIARSYLVHIGNLDWTQINPDIFGSMIQAVADDEERGSLGMHYTSVPNILRVLNPLFLGDLREKLEEAGDSSRRLLNLRNRMARIRVFDPACGSGNFLVIAYKQMREIENEINKRRGEPGRKSDIPLTNFRGIEFRDFSAEIARLALIIAEYQCDVVYRGQKEALQDFLPLDAENWITCGNALRLDWLSLCPPTGIGVKLHSDDLFQTPLDQSEIDFENEGGETYICGNPPYLGGTVQSAGQKADLEALFAHRARNWKSLDYVSGWFLKFADYASVVPADCAFVSTKSICQGEQVARLWPLIFSKGVNIKFAHTPFHWKNLAAHNAGVTVVIIGLTCDSSRKKTIFYGDGVGETSKRTVPNINAYLVAQPDVIVEPRSRPFTSVAEMLNGNKPVDGSFLMLDLDESREILRAAPEARTFIRPFLGSSEYIKGQLRYCIWVTEEDKERALSIPAIRARVERVAEFRGRSKKELTRRGVRTPYKFQQVRQRGNETVIVVPRVSSENRDYLPVGIQRQGAIIGDRNFALYDAPSWNMAVIVSRLHWVWIGTVCVRMRNDFSYSSTLGWNTFPLPHLTEKNKADLSRCAERIMLAREAHFPATIADLYDPDGMPTDLREAHEQNDEVLERIYIGRRFKNDTERLEKLFELYAKMTAPDKAVKS